MSVVMHSIGRRLLSVVSHRLSTAAGFFKPRKTGPFIGNNKVYLCSEQYMPVMGLGTCQIDDYDTMYRAVKAALDAGYRCFDTAYMYPSEKLLGEVLTSLYTKDLKREDIFLISKLPYNAFEPTKCYRSFHKTLKNLKTDYLDLYLIHSPVPTVHTGNDDEVIPMEGDRVRTDDLDFVEAWRVMVDLQDLQYPIKSIGVSNFNIRQIERCAKAVCTPHNVQIECHPYLDQSKLLEFCHEWGIYVTAFAPLGSPGFPAYARKHLNIEINSPVLLEDERLIPIAKAHDKTPAQILLNWLNCKGVCMIPKSVNPDRIRENAQIFDFKLTQEECDEISSMNRNYRYFKMDYWKGYTEHPEYPFKEDS